MKRFVLLCLVLISLWTLEAKTEADKEEACVCEEGQKECPCLAQKEAEDNRDSKSFKKAKVTPPPFAVKSKRHSKKLIEKKKYAHIAPAEREMLLKLRAKLLKTKSKIKAVKNLLSRAAPRTKPKLIVKRRKYKMKYRQIRRMIKATKMKLAYLVNKYSEECKKKAKPILPGLPNQPIIPGLPLPGASKKPKIPKFLVSKSGKPIVPKAILEKMKPEAIVTKSKEGCLELQKKLAVELKNISKLKKHFGIEISNAVKKSTRKAVLSILDTKTKITAANKKISKLKAQIRKSPIKLKKQLNKKVRKLKVLLRHQKKRLGYLVTKLKQLKVKATLDGVDKVHCKEKEKVLVDEQKVIRLQIKEIMVAIKHIKITAKDECEDTLKEEKLNSEKLIGDIQRKINLAKNEAEALRKALEAAKKAGELESKAAVLRLKALQTTDADLKAKLKGNAMKLSLEIAKLRKEEMLNKDKAKRFKKELAQKTKSQLVKEKNRLKVKEDQIASMMKEALEKEDSLRKALAKAQDEDVKSALKKQWLVAKAKLKGFSIKLKKAHSEQRTLELELDLQSKTAAEQKREAQLKKTQLIKKMKAKIAKSKLAFGIKAKQAEKAALDKMKLKEDAKLKKLKMLLVASKAKLNAYKIALRTSTQKQLFTILQAQKSKNNSKIRVLEAKLKKTKEEYRRGKFNLDKSNAVKLDELLKSLKAKYAATKLLYEKKIVAAKAHSKALQEAEEMKSKKEIAAAKAKAKVKIDALEVQISAIKAANLKAEQKMLKALNALKAKGSKLQKDIANEKVLATKFVATKAKWKKDEKAKSAKLIAAETKTKTTKLAAIKKSMKAADDAGLIAQAKLKASLKVVLALIAAHEKELKTERKTYKALSSEISVWTAKHAVTSKAAIAKEQADRAAYRAKTMLSIEACAKNIAKEKEEVYTLQGKIQDTIAKIDAMDAGEKRRKMAKEETSVYEANLSGINTQIGIFQTTITTACDDFSPDASPDLCTKAKNDLAQSQAKSEELSLKLADVRDKYYSA